MFLYRSRNVSHDNDSDDPSPDGANEERWSEYSTGNGETISPRRQQTIDDEQDEQRNDMPLVLTTKHTHTNAQASRHIERYKDTDAYRHIL